MERAFICLATALFLGTSLSAEAKMKMFCQCTKTHKSMKDEYFLPSIKDDFEIVIEEHEQHSSTGEFSSPGFNDTMIDKTEFVIKLIKENWGQVFIFSDVDIQFFKPCKQIIGKLVADKDLLFQHEGAGRINAGFFVVRANEKTLALWQKALKLLKINPQMNDQGILQALIKKNSNLKFGLLPDQFWNYGIKNSVVWHPGDDIDVPADIVMHHACYVVGVKNKITQLKLVKDLVDKKR